MFIVSLEIMGIVKRYEAVDYSVDENDLTIYEQDDRHVIPLHTIENMVVQEVEEV